MVCTQHEQRESTLAILLLQLVCHTWIEFGDYVMFYTTLVHKWQLSWLLVKGKNNILSTFFDDFAAGAYQLIQIPKRIWSREEYFSPSF